MPLAASNKSPRKLHCLDAKSLAPALKAMGGAASSWAADHGFKAQPGRALVFPDGGTGGIKSAVIGSRDPFRDGALAAGLPPVVWERAGKGAADKAAMESFALGFLMQQYRFDRFRAKRPRTPEASLLVRDAALRKRVEAINAGITLGRDLINLPANHLTPAGLEREARRLAKTFGAKISVIKGKALEKGFPAIDVVGRSAEVPPRLIDIRWGGRGPAVTIIGKGVTFDSGGLDLKPAGAMEIMKKDMGGSGIALGLARAVMGLGLKIRLRVLVPAAENAVSARSFRPLDVIETRAGIPVEVGNTDAEGRLLLADALHLATEESPDLLVDFATLTGAARVAVGSELPALFCNDDRLSSRFTKAAEKAGDPLWPMPLHGDYERHLDAGHVALSSTGTSRFGGAITAALFLQRFLRKPVPWAHIDVMAWNLAPRPGHPRGGEAMGLRAALALVEELAGTGSRK